MGAIIIGNTDVITQLVRGPAQTDYAISAVGSAESVAIATQAEPDVVPGTYFTDGAGWSSPSPGVLRWDNDVIISALVRARLAVRATVAGPIVVRAGVGKPGSPPTIERTQTISVDNGLFQHVTAEALVLFNRQGDNNEVALIVANETSDDDLEVLSAQLLASPFL